MPIRLLPARLANQIAAGEVVERPASVIKELAENSLDAGATQITIDIEKGGRQLMRVRDNGSGIAKDELALALSRHATSKIASLDDLQAIASLGFRGEALASISSVSRLLLSSRPADQAQGWQAFAEGSEMAVQLQPVAHPVGTTVEVADLFFNTPARRKFLRTDKTEFQHIDELIRRLALAHPAVQFSLSHNGQRLRYYRAVDEKQLQRRLADVCGKAFASQASHFEAELDGMRLWGYLLPPRHCRQTSEVNYCYINGRMIRDKLLLHAIRQAYLPWLDDVRQPAFVVHLQLDPAQMDINVHPAKHEVRFHQARLVHDFVTQAIASSLEQLSGPVVGGLPADQTAVSRPPDRQDSSTAAPLPVAPLRAATVALERPPYRYQRQAIDHQALANYGRLLQADRPSSTDTPLALQAVADGWFIAVCRQQAYWLDGNSWLRRQLCQQLLSGQSPSQPLLLPVRLQLDAGQCQRIKACESQLAAFGFGLKWSAQALIVQAVPALLRHTDIANSMQKLAMQADIDTPEALAMALLTDPLPWDEHWQQRFAASLNAETVCQTGIVIRPPEESGER